MSGARLGILIDCSETAALVRAAELADQLGLDSVWVGCGDRVGGPEERQAEVLTVLAALAARTRDVRLGAVLGELLSVPPHLAEDVGVVDQASGGRLELVVSAEDAARFAAVVRALRAAWRGAPLADGRQLAVTPRPHQPIVPVLAMAGTAALAAGCADRCLWREELAVLGRGEPAPVPGRTVVLVEGETFLGQLRADPSSELATLRRDLDAADACELVIGLDPTDEHLADDISLLAAVAGPVLRAASEDEAVMLANDATAWRSRLDGAHAVTVSDNV